MKFINTALLAISTAAATVSAGGSCDYGDPSTGPFDKDGLHNCLANYNWDNWDGTICGSRGWYKGHNIFWQSPQDCYNYCADCISEGINQGRNSASCVVNGGGASQCWMGYH